MLNLCLHFQEFQPIYADKGYAYIGKSVCKENFHQKRNNINQSYLYNNTLYLFCFTQQIWSKSEFSWKGLNSDSLKTSQDPSARLWCFSKNCFSVCFIQVYLANSYQIFFIHIGKQWWNYKTSVTWMWK